MKADLTKVATQYARALFDLANDEGKADRVLNDLQVVNLSIASEPKFQILLRSPLVSTPQRKEMMKDIAGAKKAEELTLRLLDMLSDRRRLEILPYIEESYREILREKRGIVVGTLISAEKLDETQRVHLENKLRHKLGGHMELHTEVDPSLIGGFVLRVGDQVIDGSLKGRLQAIERSLLSI
jgi:F-type H+-transporting ATPase subunit delta